MTDQPRSHHYAFALKRVRGGYRVDHVIEFRSRGEADKHSLTLLGRYGDADSITLDREQVVGEVLKSADLRR